MSPVATTRPTPHDRHHTPAFTTADPEAMLRLLTFGGLALMHEATVLKSHTPRQRVLPLLARLAADDDRGLARDRAATLLWPDSDDRRARHSLEEAVLQIRRLGRVAGQPDVFARTPALGLDRGAITADVWEFESAVAANDLERAVAIGDAGTFAEGARVEGCDELERWFASQSDKYARARAELLDRLTRRAASQSDHEGVVRWAQRSIAMDPGDRRATLALLDALEAQHERARALVAAERFQQRLAELDMDADVEVAERIRRLRSTPAAPSPAVSAEPRVATPSTRDAAGEEARDRARLAGAIGARWVIGATRARGSLVTSYAGHEVGAPGAPVEVHLVQPAIAHQAEPERFVSTLRRVATLDGAHVLPVLECGAEEDLLYFVGAPRASISLGARLAAEEQLPVADALAIARGIADALAHAHDRGVVHGDLRPKHVHLRGPADPIVGAFGLVDAVAAGRSVGDEGSVAVSFGDRAYQSPEQLRQAVRTSVRGDVYAFGVIVYEMLAGERPFAPRGGPVEVGGRLTGAAPPLRDRRERVPEGFARVVDTCLARVPADRYASGVPLAGALAALDA